MKALIVEDHEDVASFIRRGLQYEKFLVDVAPDGEMALEKAGLNEYDILIVDLLLPKMDGMEFLSKVRELGNNTPALILTAIQDDETKVKLLNLGADDYLSKPFSFNELLARIQAIVRRSRGLPKKQILQVADLTLDPVKREVRRAGKKIVLRNKEFSLLEYLMNHAGQVLNRTVLLEQVWDMNADVFSNTVETHMTFLRKKVDKDYPQKLIQTMHGAGYTITEEQ